MFAVSLLHFLKLIYTTAMTDDNVRTSETTSTNTSTNNNGDSKTKEVSTEKKTTVEDMPEKTTVQTTTIHN